MRDSQSRTASAIEFCVFFDAPEGFLRVRGVAGRPAVAGAHGVDENQVGEGKPAIGVVREMHRRLGRGAIRLERHDPRSHRGQVKKSGASTWAAIEGEGYGADAGALHGVGHVEDLGGKLALGAVHRQGAGGGFVGELLPAECDRVLCYAVFGELCGEARSWPAMRLGLVMPLGGRLLRARLRECEQQQQDERQFGQVQAAHVLILPRSRNADGRMRHRTRRRQAGRGMRNNLPLYEGCVGRCRAHHAAEKAAGEHGFSFGGGL